MKTCVELLSFADALQSISCWAQTEARITGLGSYIIRLASMADLVDPYNKSL